jgi:hypothetical protein
VRPDGKEFGKGGLHITTVPAFKRRAAGYMHEYEVQDVAMSRAAAAIWSIGSREGGE